MQPTYSYGHDDPHRLEPTSLYAELRSKDPVARVTTPYGDDAWLVTRHGSVKVVLHDARFSRAAAVAQHDRVPRSTAHVPTVNPISAVDPPEHSRLRQLVSGAFTKRKAEQHRARTEQIANELIDEMIAVGAPGDIDRVFARRLPILSFGEILGVPPSECVQVKEWTEPLMSRRGYSVEQIAAAHKRLQDYLAALVASRREHPQDDFLTALVQAQNGKRTYTDDELVFLVASLYINDSVSSQIANFLYLLLTHPDQLAWLRTHMHQLPQALEEMLRFAPLAPDMPSGLQGHPRCAIDDIEIDGVMIRAGEWVLPSIISANRDEQVFTDPDRLDLTRTRSPHIAFGFGTHHCPGAAMARMQLRAAVTTVLTRLPNLKLAVPVDEVSWKTGYMNRGTEKLPVTW